MTICAGMVSSDGLILAADSEETVDEYLKVSRPKFSVLPLVSEELRCVVVGAGDGIFVDDIVEKLSDRLDLVNPYIAEVKKTIEETIADACNRVWPLYATQVDKPQASLIIGVRAIDGLLLLESSVPILRIVHPFSFIGCGRVLGLYKAKQLITDIFPVNVGVPILAHIIGVVKESVVGCGGDTHMIVIHPDGQVEQKQKAYIEQASRGYNSVAWALDTFVFPFLPLIVSDDGTDILMRIAALGIPNIDSVRDKLKGAIELLASRKKAILSGVVHEIQEEQRIRIAFGGVQLAINMLLTAGEKLHKEGIIRDEILSSLKADYGDATDSAKRAETALGEHDHDKAKKHIQRTFACITRALLITGPTLNAQTSEDQK